MGEEEERAFGGLIECLSTVPVLAQLDDATDLTLHTREYKCFCCNNQSSLPYSRALVLQPYAGRRTFYCCEFNVKWDELVQVEPAGPQEANTIKVVFLAKELK